MAMKKARNANHHDYCCEAEAMPLPYLSQHLLVQILSKLPVKSLLQFKCVSNSWRSLISDSHFIKTHLDQSLKKSNTQAARKILMVTPNSPVRLYTASLGSADIAAAMLNFSFQDNPPEIKIVGSCNGLICVNIDFKFIYVFNPSTRESKQIIDCDLPGSIIGFGYDHCSDDYKLMKTIKGSIYIYSLRMDCWRKVLDIAMYSDIFGLSNGTQLNGALHFLWIKNDSDKPSGIVAFSLVDEKVWMIPMPTLFTDFDEASNLGVFEGCLCILPYGNLKFWIMKEYGVKQSWTKVDVKVPVPFSKAKAFAYLNYEETLMLSDCTHSLLYNIREGTYRELDLPDQAKEDEDFHAIIYVDSLVSPVMKNVREKNK